MEKEATAEAGVSGGGGGGVVSTSGSPRTKNAPGILRVDAPKSSRIVVQVWQLLAFTTFNLLG